MGNYTFPDNWIGFRKEGTTFRGGNGGSQATPTALADTNGGTKALPFDDLEESIDAINTWLKLEESRVLGGGPDVDVVTVLGYEVAETDLPLKMQTAIMDYYVMGSCSTAGTALPTNGTFTGFGTTSIVVTAAAGSYSFMKNALVGIPIKLVGATTVYTYITAHAATAASTLALTIHDAAPATGGGNTCQFCSTDAGTNTVKAGSQGTVMLTVTDLGYLPANGSMVGKMIKTSEAGTPKYIIVANTAVGSAAAGAEMVFTLDRAMGASADGTTVTYYTYPFTHTITAANSTPSMVIHHERLQTGQEKYTDAYGILVHTLEIVVEKGVVVTKKASIKAARAGAGVVLTRPTKLDIPHYVWDNLNATDSSFTYNSLTVDTSGTTQSLFNEVSSFTITVTRQIDIEPVMGDSYAYKVKWGTRDMSLKMKLTPTTMNLLTIRNTNPKDYTTPIAATLRFKLGDGQYIQYAFSSLYLADPPGDKLVMAEDRQNEIECTFKNAPAFTQPSGVINAKGTLTITAYDILSSMYYEWY